VNDADDTLQIPAMSMDNPVHPVIVIDALLLQFITSYLNFCIQATNC